MAMSAKGDTSKQSQSNKSFIAKQQLPYLENLWQQAQGVADPNAVTQAAQGVADFSSPMMRQAMTSVFGLTNPQAQIDAQAASLQSGLGDLFRNEINPAIQTNAIAAGGFGGGRQGVAEGVAAGQLANAYTQGYGDIVGRANQTALGASGMMPGMMQGLYDTETLPSMAGFDPLTTLAAILGSPTVLGKSSGKGKSAGFGFGVI
jgi:hypothetical protein